MLLREVLSYLGAGGDLDFKRTEEIACETGINTSELAKEIARSIKENERTDPVEIAYRLIVEETDYPEVFTIYPNYLATQLSVNREELFEKMKENGIDWYELDSYMQFLLSEAGITESDWREWIEE